MQRRLGLSDVVVGHLTRSREIRADAPLSLGPGAVPAVEPEIAISIGRDLAAGAHRETVAAAVAGVGPALEVIDASPLSEWPGLESLLAANVLHAGVLFAGAGPALPGVSLSGLEVVVFSRGEVVRTVDPAAALGDLVSIVQRISRLLAPHGESLRAGDRVLSGSMAPAWRLEPGDVVRVDYGRLGALCLERPDGDPRRVLVREPNGARRAAHPGAV